MQDLVSVVAGSVGDVYPAVPGLIDKLVKRDLADLLQLDNLIEKALVVGSGADGNIRRLTLQMLGGSYPAHSPVEFWTTVPAIHRDWAAPGCPDRVEQLFDECLHPQACIGIRRVVYSFAPGRVRRAHFFDGKVFHGGPVFM